MTTTVTEALDTARRPGPLSGGELAAAKTVAAMVAALGVLGFINSFRAVARAAVSSFGELAPTVPLGIDLAIAVFSALDIVLARLDMRPWWVRLVPWSLTAATIYLNVAGQVTWFGRVAHAVFPALWVVAVQLAAHVIRIRAQLVAGTRIDRIRVSRWLLAPASTARLMRRMVLWEIRSYPDALNRERARLLALTGLQDTYGAVAWRWRAPRRTRALYRLGELVPAAAPYGRLSLPVPDLPPGDDRTDDASRTDTPPDGPPGRDEVVERLADEMRDAIEAGEQWRPDYAALMASTGRRRSWCEKAVRDARMALLDPPPGSRTANPRTDTLAAARTEGAGDSGEARTGELEFAGMT